MEITTIVVIPAQAGIQDLLVILDSRSCALYGIRGNDKKVITTVLQAG